MIEAERVRERKRSRGQQRAPSQGARNERLPAARAAPLPQRTAPAQQPPPAPSHSCTDAAPGESVVSPRGHAAHVTPTPVETLAPGEYVPKSQTVQLSPPKPGLHGATEKGGGLQGLG